MAKSKLDAKQIKEIKDMYKNGGVTHAELAETYDVGIATIRRVLVGVTGKDNAPVAVSKTVNKVLSVEEEIEAMQRKMAELELKKQAAYEARYLELGKWADEFIGTDDYNDYVIVRKSDWDNAEIAESDTVDAEDDNAETSDRDASDQSADDDAELDNQDTSFDTDTGTSYSY